MFVMQKEKKNEQDIFMYNTFCKLFHFKTPIKDKKMCVNAILF